MECASISEVSMKVDRLALCGIFHLFCCNLFGGMVTTAALDVLVRNWNGFVSIALEATKKGVTILSQTVSFLEDRQDMAIDSMIASFFSSGWRLSRTACFHCSICWGVGLGSFFLGAVIGLGTE